MSRNVYGYLIAYGTSQDKTIHMYVYGAVLQPGWVIKITGSLKSLLLGHMGQAS